MRCDFIFILPALASVAHQIQALNAIQMAVRMNVIVSSGLDWDDFVSIHMEMVYWFFFFY